MVQESFSVLIVNSNETINVRSISEALDFVGGYVAACRDDSDGIGMIEPGELIIQRSNF